MADQDPSARASSAAPTATLDEMRALMRDLPGPDLEARTACVAREAMLTKPSGALGRLETLTEWLATWQGRHPPTLNHPRTAVFAGNHGITVHGVSAYPASVTQQMVENFVSGGAAVNQLCQTVDADLRVYELDLDNPTRDFTEAPAMSLQDCARAMAYGMMAVERGIDVLCLGEMGIGNTTSAAALCCALFGGEAADWVGPGTGIGGAALDKKRAIVAAGVARHKTGARDAFELLAALGGLELAAIVGSVIAARLARTPVLLDGFACTAAASVLFAIDRHALDHCQVAHRSTEPGHQRLCALIGKQPLLDLDMRLGEASAATLAVALLKAAVACHIGMATFSEAGISGPTA
ncbi:MAG TPA: nicotinate-nucleotide--dimethylbenzimidazole phosphoribosyltransferase [Candidatus Sulfotelmatobacter sp.]|nr:nicotinate-nucleotide--dimethylbenzimidazole phosphoribosyltransferase [Candidatus Sulfotelmatobacter sp.]